MSQEINRRDMLRASVASAAALAVQSGAKSAIAQCQPICRSANMDIATCRCRICGRSEKSIYLEIWSQDGSKRTYFYGLPQSLKKSELPG